MSQRASTSVIILVVLVSLFALLSGGTFYLLQQERARSFSLDEQLRVVNQKYTLNQTKLRDSEKRAERLDTSLKEARLEIEKLNGRIEEAIIAKNEALEKLDSLAGELQNEKELRMALEGRFDELQSEASKAESQLKILNTRKAELESRVKELQVQAGKLEAAVTGVDLGTIEVSSSDASPAAQSEAVSAQAGTTSRSHVFSSEKTTASSTGAEGRVMVVNRDYEFAVINLGAKDGIAEGMEFSVFQSDTYIGDITVEQLHDSMAAAGFTTPALGSKIQEGDLAVQKLR
ncbi:MAG: hypothetical protein MJA29_02570 [Candidatus Omnitrophica bacterium]|nr:hypothetical protein [Candidatus Omnitrophota bacterium]